MINRMVVNNVGYRPVRTALSVIAVAVEVLLIISVVGLVHGLLEEGAQRQRGLGADIIVQPTGASAMMGLTSSPMPAKLANWLLEHVPGVTAATPVLLQNSGGLTLVGGMDVSSFTAVTGGLRILEGRMINPGSYELVVDDVYAQDNNLHIGHKRTLWERQFELVGIFASGKGARIYVPLGIMQDLLLAKDRASVIYLRVQHPDDAGRIVADLKKLPGLSNHPIYTMREFTSLMASSGSIPGVRPFERIMIGIAVVIGFLVIFLAMYTTVLERTREIGTLKALGASKGYIVNIILRETVVVSAIGIVVGIAASYLLRAVVIRAYPTLSVTITPGWLVAAGLIAVAGSLLGASYPALRAARQDPIEALAYE